MQRAEGVDKAVLKEAGHLGTLLVGKSGILAVGLRVLEVNLLMRHIKVAAQNYGFLLVQILYVGKEVVLPCHAVVESAQAVLRVGRVARNEIEALHLERNDTSLVAVLVDADAEGYVHRLFFCKNRRTRVSFLVRVIPVFVITRQIHLNLIRLQLTLLNAENIRIHLMKNI